MVLAGKKLSVQELKKRTEENEMDLSLMGIEEVPVGEISSVTKANTLDLSCNCIVRLPDLFCPTLHYLVKLDLSKNLLVELPSDIFKLKQLQHLDLYQNKLNLIPVGFSQLNNLTWLDLKDNPLDVSYTKIVGDCLNDRQCRQCAINIIAAMKVIASSKETERQNMLKEQRKKEALIQAEKQQVEEMKKKEKRLEKERRRREWESKQTESTEPKESDNKENYSNEKKVHPVDTKDTKIQQRSGGFGIGSLLLFMLVAFVAVIIGAYYYCDNNAADRNCLWFHDYFRNLLHALQAYLKIISDAYHSTSELLKSWFAELIEKLKQRYSD